MHYYDPQTNSRAFPKKANGEEYKAVPRSVIDKLGLVPGVTDIMKSASPFEGLRFWERTTAIEQTCIQLGASQAQQDMCRVAVAQFLEQPANEGTRKHAAAEKGIHGDFDGLDGVELAAAQEVFSQVRRLWSPADHQYRTEVEFATSEYGGTLDLLVWNGETLAAVVDFKFPTSERDVRTTECAQLAAYIEGLRKELTCTGQCGIVAQNWLFGEEGSLYQIRQYTGKQMEVGLAMFRALYDSYLRVRAMTAALREKEMVSLSNQPDVS